jgi:hypothetical protein
LELVTAKRLCWLDLYNLQPHTPPSTIYNSFSAPAQRQPPTMHLTTITVILGASAIFAKKSDKPDPPAPPPRYVAPIEIDISMRSSCSDTAWGRPVKPKECVQFKTTKGMHVVQHPNPDLGLDSGEFLFF